MITHKLDHLDTIPGLDHITVSGGEARRNAGNGRPGRIRLRLKLIKGCKGTIGNELLQAATLTTEEWESLVDGRARCREIIEWIEDLDGALSRLED